IDFQNLDEGVEFGHEIGFVFGRGSPAERGRNASRLPQAAGEFESLTLFGRALHLDFVLLSDDGGRGTKSDGQEKARCFHPVSDYCVFLPLDNFGMHWSKRGSRRTA